MKKKQKPPPGWDEARIKEVLAHHEGQSVDEQFTEIQAAREVAMISDALREELLRRDAEDDANPDDIVPADEVIAQALSRLQS